jgi:hypothetical protein
MCTVIETDFLAHKDNLYRELQFVGGGNILKMDHTFTVAGKVFMDGSRIAKASHCIMNEYGQVRSHFAAGRLSCACCACCATYTDKLHA